MFAVCFLQRQLAWLARPNCTGCSHTPWWQSEGMSPPGAVWGAEVGGEASSPRAESSPALLTARGILLHSRKMCSRDKNICDGCVHPTSAHQSGLPACPQTAVSAQVGRETGGKEWPGARLQQGLLKPALPERSVCESTGKGARRCLVLDPTDQSCVRSSWRESPKSLSK